MMHRS